MIISTKITRSGLAARYGKYQKFVVLRDSGIASFNFGDEVIAEACADAAAGVCAAAGVPIVRLPSHDGLGIRGRTLAMRSYATMIGGTNLLGDLRPFRRLMKLSTADFVPQRRALLLGVGAYHPNLDAISGALWRSVLSLEGPHSVRDVQAADRLLQLGVPEQNVFVTSCPTTWQLEGSEVTGKLSNTVVVAFSPSDPPVLIREVLAFLHSSYDRVLVWNQSLMQGLSVAAPTDTAFHGSIRSLDDVLDSGADFVGSRLHGGIRALQRGRASIIWSVDHRAQAISKICGIPVVDRDGVVDSLRAFVNGDVYWKVNPPVAAIANWRGATQRFLRTTGVADLEQQADQLAKVRPRSN